MPPRNNLRNQLAQRRQGSENAEVLVDFIARADGICSPSELQSAYRQVCSLTDTAKGNTSLLLAHVDKRQAVNLFTLFGLSLRRSGGIPGGDDSRQLYRNLRAVLSKEVTSLFRTVIKPDASQRQQLLLDLMLRTHVLRCYSQLALAASQQLRERPSQRNAEATMEALTEIEELLWSLGQALSTVAVFGKERCTPKRMFEQALQAELHQSGLLEAWATCFLQLLAHEEGASGGAATLLSCMVNSVKCLEVHLDGFGCLGTATPAFQYLLALHAVRALSLLDGGTAYGLPAGAPQVPLFCRLGALVRGGPGGAVDGVMIVQAFRWWQHLRNHHTTGGVGGPSAPAAAAAAAPPLPELVAALPPFNTTAGFDIAIRVACAAVASARQQKDATAQRQRGAVFLESSHCGQVAAYALLLAGSLLLDMWGGADRPWKRWRPRDAARAKALWAAYVSALNAGLDCGWDEVRHPRFASDTKLRCNPVAADMLACVPRLDSAPLTGLPSAPGAAVAALLASSAIPCCERLLRAQPGTTRLLFLPSNWPELLMFGDMGQLAALVTTAAKAAVLALQHVPELALFAPQAALSPFLAAEPDLFPRLHRLHTTMVWLEDMFNLDQLIALTPALAAAIGSTCSSGGPMHAGGGAEGGGAAVGGGGGGAQEAGSAAGDDVHRGAGGGGGGPAPRLADGGPHQLVRLYSFAAARLLPAVAIAVERACALSTCKWSEPAPPDCKDFLANMLPWHLPVLLRWFELLLAADVLRARAAVRIPSRRMDMGAAPLATLTEWGSILGCAGLVNLLGVLSQVLPQRLPGSAQWSAVQAAFKRTLKLACASMSFALYVACLAPAAKHPDAGPGAGSPDGGAEPCSSDGTADEEGELLTTSLLALLAPDGACPDAALRDLVRCVAENGPIPDEAWALEPELAAAAALLEPPSVSMRGLSCCANVQCCNVEGPSEAHGGSGKCRCAGCDAACYCSRECQLAHWRSVHRLLCPGRGKGAPGAGVAAAGSGGRGV